MKNASPPPGRHEPNENRVQEWKDEARAKISNLKKKLEQQKLDCSAIAGPVWG